MKFFYRITLFVLLIGAGNNGFAQKQLSEGTVSYKIAIVSEQSAAISSNLNGAELTIYLKPSLSRSEMTSSLGTETTVYDNQKGKGFILREYSGQKLMITATKQNWAQKNQWNDNLKFTIDPAVVSIGGYDCKKAIATTQDGKTFNVYFTPDIILTNRQYNNSFDQLPGLPVQYEIKSGNLTFKYSLSKVSYETVAAAKFEEPKTGYRVMTYEENQQLKKGN
jgi:GLPGLI family protein